MDEKTEMRRMLEWFKAQLPPHELEWDIFADPILEPIRVEGDTPHVQALNGFRVRGRGKCQRCDGFFSIPAIGNAVAHSEDRIPAVVEDMKKWVERGTGPCWGDIPEVWDGTEPIAVLDSTT